MPLGTPESPPIVSGVPDMHPSECSKRGRDTESDANIQPEEMLTFFSNEYSICISTWNPEVVFLSNITYRPKERYAYSGNSFENKIWIFPLTNGETSSIIIYASRRRTISYCQIRTLEKYSSGRRGAPAKGIGRVNRREGSNPSFSALFEDMSCSIFFWKSCWHTLRYMILWISCRVK